jgi:IS30 family transposase
LQAGVGGADGPYQKTAFIKDRAPEPLRSHVGVRLAMGWLPERIAGRPWLEEPEHTVCHETVYRFYCRPRLRIEKLYRLLSRAKATSGRRYFKRRREPIPARRSIHDRPAAVEDRDEFGHWEGDLVQFHIQRGNVLTLCKCKARSTVAAPLRAKTAAETDAMLRRVLTPLPQPARRTITFDNDSEFALHHNPMETLATKAFSCDPHSPWQRAAIENTNGIIRRDIPRKTHFNDFTSRDIDELARATNSTPRKCLRVRLIMYCVFSEPCVRVSGRRDGRRDAGASQGRLDAAGREHKAHVGRVGNTQDIMSRTLTFKTPSETFF